MLRRPSTSIWYGLLIVIAITLGLVLPPTTGMLHTLNISLTDYRLSISTIILPYALILFLAFYAYNRLQAYTIQLRRTREGHAFKNIAEGVRVLAWGLAIPTILAIILNSINVINPEFNAVRIIIINYAILLVPLISFIYISNGTRLLNDIARVRIGLNATRFAILTFLIIGVFYAHQVLSNSNHPPNPYHLSLYWLILTIIIPNLYAWFIGLLSANEIRLYAQAIKGIIYKKALLQLASGLAIIIIGSITAQFISSVFVTKNSVSLGSAFITTYAVVVIEVIGFGLLAYGVQKLKRIEEV